MAPATPQVQLPPPQEPSLWHEPAPRHFDLAVPWWIKTALVAVLTLLAMFFLDQRIALYNHDHPIIPDLAQVASVNDNARYRGSDAGRELMFLEQWGQGVCSVCVIAAVALIDPKGRRRALALAVGCLLTVLLTHLLKDICGRSRPFIPGTNAADGSWVFGGPTMGFHGGSKWGSFPSAHTTAAFALASGLAWFYPRARGLFMGLAVITAAQRVLHTAHFLSDVIAGLGIGVGVMRSTLAAKFAGRLIAVSPPSLRAWWLRDA